MELERSKCATTAITVAFQWNHNIIPRHHHAAQLKLSGRSTHKERTPHNIILISPPTPPLHPPPSFSQVELPDTEHKHFPENVHDFKFLRFLRGYKNVIPEAAEAYRVSKRVVLLCCVVLCSGVV